MSRALASSSSSSSSSWMSHLPLVLLGLRTTVREDAGCCPADVVFGDQLRLPGDLLDPGPPFSAADSAFAADLQSTMARLRPLAPVRRGPPLLGHVPSALDRVSHVFLRVDAVRRPLTPPYDGPFAVLERGKKTFKILKSGKEITVSIDRLKPAFLSDIFQDLTDPVPSDPDPAVAVTASDVVPGVIFPLRTRSGRTVTPPPRLGISD